MTRRVTKKWRTEEARRIIDRNEIGKKFNDQDLEAFLDVCQFNADGLRRMINPQFSNDPRHLHALINGDWVAISWRDAINNPDPVQKVKRVMRHVIADDLADFRSSVEPKHCWICYSVDDMTVDHVDPPFNTIANDFITFFGVPEIMPSSDPTVVVDMFVEPDMEAHWIAWHAQQACYQMLCRSCNSSKGAR